MLAREKGSVQYVHSSYIWVDLRGGKKMTCDAHMILCPQKKSWFLQTGIHLSKFKNKQTNYMCVSSSYPIKKL
jgi:hypothetical protein